VIKQRTLATDHIIELINKFDLYPEARKRAPISEVVVEVREDIDVELLSAKITDPRSGRPKEANIAFSVAYQYSNPAIAQKVANELVSFYLTISAKTSRRGRAKQRRPPPSSTPKRRRCNSSSQSWKQKWRP